MRSTLRRARGLAGAWCGFGGGRDQGRREVDMVLWMGEGWRAVVYIHEVGSLLGRIRVELGYKESYQC
ncbi:vegetative cell wall protein gp1-like [Iris pallida]|uniref:Vegetative cell wall protein gp1-like n=1 Tax=Iris pallida TaxID=29817 RepID=A0AAX6ICK8_IRIPA|nr:vegetative cell wall protein gp1-like [Iris pallida]